MRQEITYKKNCKNHEHVEAKPYDTKQKLITGEVKKERKNTWRQMPIMQNIFDIAKQF